MERCFWKIILQFVLGGLFEFSENAKIPKISKLSKWKFRQKNYVFLTKSFKINIDIFDPIVDHNEVKHNSDVEIISEPIINNYDLIVITVSHQLFKDLGIKKIRSWCNKNGSIMDLKNTFPKKLVDYTV